MQNSNITLMWLSPISDLPNCPNSFACSTYHSVCVFFNLTHFCNVVSCRELPIHLLFKSVKCVSGTEGYAVARWLMSGGIAVILMQDGVNVIQGSEESWAMFIETRVKSFNNFPNNRVRISKWLWVQFIYSYQKILHSSNVLYTFIVVKTE